MENLASYYPKVTNFYMELSHYRQKSYEPIFRVNGAVFTMEAEIYGSDASLKTA